LGTDQRCRTEVPISGRCRSGGAVQWCSLAAAPASGADQRRRRLRCRSAVPICGGADQRCRSAGPNSGGAGQRQRRSALPMSDVADQRGRSAAVPIRGADWRCRSRAGADQKVPSSGEDRPWMPISGAAAAVPIRGADQRCRAADPCSGADQRCRAGGADQWSRAAVPSGGSVRLESAVAASGLPVQAPGAGGVVPARRVGSRDVLAVRFQESSLRGGSSGQPASGSVGSGEPGVDPALAAGLLGPRSFRSDVRGRRNRLQEAGRERLDGSPAWRPDGSRG